MMLAKAGQIARQVPKHLLAMAAGATSRPALTHSARRGTGAPTRRLGNTEPRTALEGFTSSATPMGGFNERGRRAARVRSGGSARGTASKAGTNSNWSNAHRITTWARRCPKKNSQTLRTDGRAACWLAHG